MIVKVKKIFSIFLSCILIFSLFYLPSYFQIEVVAQGGLLNHQDTVNGFTVSYPASWNKQDNVYGTHGVQLSPNLAARDNVLIDVVQQPGATLESWTQEKIGSINSRQGASILQLNPTTLGSNPAYKVEYVWEGDKILEMWTVIGDKLYAFSYVGEGEEKYQQNLPAVQNIIDSFQLANAGSLQATTTTATPTSPAKPNNDDNSNDDKPPIGDSRKTATGDRKYNQDGAHICGNDETGEEWRCGPDESDDENDDDNDNDSDLDNDSNDNDNDCQTQDDFCDNDEGCESESVDCIDDRGFDEDDYNG
jgi:hypothetical protein